VCQCRETLSITQGKNAKTQEESWEVYENPIYLAASLSPFVSFVRFCLPLKCLQKITKATKRKYPRRRILSHTQSWRAHPARIPRFVVKLLKSFPARADNGVATIADKAGKGPWL
jgi:hypothetical protein